MYYKKVFKKKKVLPKCLKKFPRQTVLLFHCFQKRRVSLPFCILICVILEPVPQITRELHFFEDRTVSFLYKSVYEERVRNTNLTYARIFPI